MSHDDTGPPFGPSGGDGDQIVRYLRLADLANRLNDEYRGALDTLVFSRTPNPFSFDEKNKKLDSVKKILRGEFARVTLTHIWKESTFVPVQSLKCVGYSKVYRDGKINQNRLATTLCIVSGIIDLNEMQAAQRRVGRLVSAAGAFRLIEFSTREGQSKPLKATRLLHEVMEACHGNTLSGKGRDEDDQGSISIDDGE